MPGLVFTAVTAPYLESEYGVEYMSDSPVRLLDSMLHGFQEYSGQQVPPLPAAPFWKNT